MVAVEAPALTHLDFDMTGPTCRWSVEHQRQQHMFYMHVPLAYEWRRRRMKRIYIFSQPSVLCQCVLHQCLCVHASQFTWKMH